MTDKEINNKHKGADNKNNINNLYGKKIMLGIGYTFGYACIAIGIIMALLILTTYQF